MFNRRSCLKLCRRDTVWASLRCSCLSLETTWAPTFLQMFEAFSQVGSVCPSQPQKTFANTTFAKAPGDHQFAQSEVMERFELKVVKLATYIEKSWEKWGSETLHNRHVMQMHFMQDIEVPWNSVVTTGHRQVTWKWESQILDCMKTYIQTHENDP